ncbi:MAG: hypothetical protein JKX97_03320, partial [Candidatus Lindowbacteria bacterium]|nr:hypothetical protein [Candidatus Lindowbacteria bacterium]
TDRDGRYLGSKNIPGEYPPGGAVDIDVDGIIGELDQPAGDYMAIIVLSSGVMNFFGGSPGAFSVTYVGEKTYTTYRTGGFTRTLNDPRKKKHYGFRGINPKIVVDDSFMSSILLINHSSYTGYEKEITPEAKLIREDGETREAKFGLIQPFGGLERNMEELFGTDVSDFLAPYKGRGTVITRATGATLAAIHLLRKTDGTSMAIEHSRPTHAYLLNGA